MYESLHGGDYEADHKSHDGVSLFRFTAPLLIVSFAMAFGLFAFENKFVVQTYDKKNVLQARLLDKTKSENNSNVIVLSDNGRIIYKAERYIENQKRLRTCIFVFRDDEKNLQAVIYCTQAQWNADMQIWELERPVQYEPVPGENTLRITPLSSEWTSKLTESYEIFRKTNVDVESVTAAEAKVYVNHLKKAGLPYNEELSEYYKKYALVPPFRLFRHIGIRFDQNRDYECSRRESPKIPV